MRLFMIHSNNTSMYSPFFDLEKAFPGVWQHLILRTFHKYGLRSLLPRLLDDNRSFQVRVANHLSSFYIHSNEVPRVSPLSGTLFRNRIFSTIPNLIQPIFSSTTLVTISNVTKPSVPTENAMELEKLLHWINIYLDKARLIGIINFCWPPNSNFRTKIVLYLFVRS